MLRGDVIYNLSFRFRGIGFSNVNDIYFAISIAVIATTFFETFVVIVFVFKLVIIIVFDVDDIVVIIIVIFEESVFKLIAFDFDIKNCFAMNTLFDKF